ncbi:hypothetical protein Ancab_023299 [Ancistrocladus abbreviatus]
MKKYKEALMARDLRLAKSTRNSEMIFEGECGLDASANQESSSQAMSQMLWEEHSLSIVLCTLKFRRGSSENEANKTEARKSSFEACRGEMMDKKELVESLPLEQPPPAAEEQPPIEEKLRATEEQTPAREEQPTAVEKPTTDEKPPTEKQTPANRMKKYRVTNITVPTSPIRIPMYTGSDFGVGLYFVDLEIGTPPQKMKLIVDTASDLTWINCTFSEETRKVLKQPDNDKVRRFKADDSASFKTITCNSTMCKKVLADTFSLRCCPNPSAPCMYNIRYAPT